MEIFIIIYAVIFFYILFTLSEVKIHIKKLYGGYNNNVNNINNNANVSVEEFTSLHAKNNQQETEINKLKAEINDLRERIHFLAVKTSELQEIVKKHIIIEPEIL